MSLTAGTSLGTYSVVRLLGAGGMGEVYQARDTRLGRDVAIKVLPDGVANDPDRLARFEREAQLLASLNHRNISQLYGIEDSAGVRALVLELVEGPTLEERIAQSRTGLPIEEAITVARQVADAVEAAHERGVIHRDLKPANIKCRPDGTVKVLDFGLAKALDEPASSAIVAGNVSGSPTLTFAATRAGVILGTAAYMSPEQARGGSVDKRADIWAFGCVLYEMLAGRSAFAGATVSDTLVSVLSHEPDWTALPSTIPAGITTMLKRCLQKDQNLRLRDIVDARFQIDDARVAVSTAQQQSSLTWWGYAGWVAAAVVALVASIAWMTADRTVPIDLPEMRLQIVTPPADDPFSFALSPEGRSLVYQARVDGRSQLWLRSLDRDEPQALMGTDGGTFPFWSPDGASVGFFADGLLKRLDLAGGFVRTLTNAPNPRRGAWASDGTIVFSASVGPMRSVSANGGSATDVTALLQGQTGHRWPQFLPDGRRFLFYAMGEVKVRGVYVGSVTDKTAQRVSEGVSPFALLYPGHVLLASQGALWFRRLARDYATFEGDLLPIAPRVLVNRSVNGLAALTVSTVGSVAFRTSEGSSQFVWFDRAGRQLAGVGDVDSDQRYLGNISVDGRTAAAQRTVNGNTDIWLFDVERGVPRRLTLDPSIDGEPIISPDGSHVVFVSDRKANVWDMYERFADGRGEETLLLESGENKNPRDWSLDGRYILYASQSPKTDYDLWALAREGDRTPIPIAQTPFVENQGRFAPDGRAVAYESNESGRTEVYLQPFPGPGPKIQVSVGGGALPRWRRDGRELFYVGMGNRLMAASIVRNAAGLEAITPVALFNLQGVSRYEPSSDGQRFLVDTPVATASPITIILNWKPPALNERSRSGSGE